MRKAVICLLVLLCSFAAYGQKQPQWKVVQEVTLFNQDSPISQTVLFVPDAAGRYRYTAYISANGAPQNVGWDLDLSWTDLTGLAGGVVIGAYLNAGASSQQLGTYAFTPKSGTPVSFTLLHQLVLL
jgi:hypothetical protein